MLIRFVLALRPPFHAVRFRHLLCACPSMSSAFGTCSAPALSCYPFCPESASTFLCHPVYAPLLCAHSSLLSRFAMALHTPIYAIPSTLPYSALPFHAVRFRHLLYTCPSMLTRFQIPGEKAGNYPCKKRSLRLDRRLLRFCFKTVFYGKIPPKIFFGGLPQTLYALPHIGAEGNPR